MIKELVEIMKSVVSQWHSEDLTWFDQEFNSTTAGSIEELSKKLSFHNYCIWHFIEGYKDPDTNRVNFVYLGGLEHNQLRNQTIELIDDFFISKQINTGDFNSETIGSILDRICNLIIKIKHLEDINDSRIESLQKQLDFLISCADSLFVDMQIGKRQILQFSRFKTTGYK